MESGDEKRNQELETTEVSVIEPILNVHSQKMNSLVKRETWKMFVKYIVNTKG